MTMTAEQKMNKLLETIGGLLHEKDEAISLKEWQLKKANEEIEALKEQNKELEAENKELLEALRSAKDELHKHKYEAITISQDIANIMRGVD